MSKLVYLLFVLVGFSVQAQSDSALTHETALAAVQAAREQAEKEGTTVNIAIVDAGANLKAFMRMDGSYLGSIDIAIKKAKTARFFDMDTADLGKLTQPGGMLYQIELTNGGMVSFPGGVPIKNADGDVIGAIGISGGTIEQDQAIANAGAQSILN